MTIFVDSDILIEVSRAREEQILNRWIELADSAATLWYSPVTEAELWAGARPDEYAATEAILQRLICAAIDRETGRKAGEYLARYGKSHCVEIADALIAAGAFVHQAAIWTRNRKHFPMRDLTFF